MIRLYKSTCTKSTNTPKLIDWGSTSHQTHYRSYRGQMTQPTVSKHWRKIGPKDQASIPSGPPHCAHIDTTTVWNNNTQNTQINQSMHSEMGPVWQNPNNTPRRCMVYLTMVCLSVGRSVCLSVCLSVTSHQDHWLDSMRIFPQMYLWTWKNLLNFGCHLQLDSNAVNF